MSSFIFHRFRVFLVPCPARASMTRAREANGCLTVVMGLPRPYGEAGGADGPKRESIPPFFYEETMVAACPAYTITYLSMNPPRRTDAATAPEIQGLCSRIALWPMKWGISS